MLKKIFASLMAVVLVLGLLPTVALADTGDVAEDATAVESYASNLGADMPDKIPEDTPLSVTPFATYTMGTCTWEIDDDGCLTIAPADGVSGSFSKADIPNFTWRDCPIKYVKIAPGVSALDSLQSMFWSCTSITSIDLTGLDTSNVTDMSRMFMYCYSLTSVDLTGLDTSNVTDMSNMFCDCPSLTSVDLTGLDTSNVTDMSNMFSGCVALKSLNMESCDTSCVTSMSHMFDGCSSLNNIDSFFFDTSNVTAMSYMFNGCSSLKSLPDGFAISAGVGNLCSIFRDCSSLTEVPEDLTIPWGVTDMSYAFSGCSSLASLPENFSIPSGMEDMSYAFQDCSSLTSLPDGVTVPYGVTNMQGILYGCSSLKSLPENFTIPSNATNLSYMFYGCSSLAEPPTIPSNVTNISYTFYGCSSFTELPDIPSGVTKMDYAFYNCTSITTLPSGFTFPSKASTTYTFGVDDPYSRANPLETWCLEGDYEYLVDSYDWVSSNRKLGIATVADDKTALEMVINAANALDSTNYTSDSWAALEDALRAAEKVLFDDYATQGEVDAATSALQSAIDALVRAVDTSALEGVIKTAELLNSADYTESSWIVLQSTLTYAKAVLDNVSSTQTEVDAATSALQSAIDALESADPGVTVDKSALEAAISAAEKLDSSDYTASSWIVLQSTLTYAKTVLDNASVTQSEVDAAVTALQSTIDSLVRIADTSALENIIKTAEELTSTDYTASSWAVLQSMLTFAKSVLDNASATQAEVDNAVDALQIAIDALVPVTSEPDPTETADKTELEMTIKAAAQLDESEYTPDSWAALQDVLQAAQSIDADGTASQAEVNEVTDALLAAIDALQKLFMDVSDPSEWYYEYVYYMAELGIITGYNETTFGVGDPMTRAQLVTIMWRYCEPDEYANYNEAAAKNTSGLPDVADGMYYTGAVNWAVSEGVVTGNQLADGSYVFSPDNNVSFEQMVTIVARYVLGFDGAEKYDTSALTRGTFTDAATVSDYARGSVAWAIEVGVVTGNQNTDGTYTIAPLEDVARERAATVLARAIQEGLIVTE